MSKAKIISLFIVGMLTMVSSGKASAMNELCRHIYAVYEVFGGQGESVGFTTEYSHSICGELPGQPDWNPIDSGGPLGGGGVLHDNYDPNLPVVDVTKEIGLPVNATCTSDGASRQLYANMVVRARQIANGLFGRLPARQRVRVRYDDGGSEIWVVVQPSFSEPLGTGPIPGTLRCPP